jgi:hypothetical protein
MSIDFDTLANVVRGLKKAEDEQSQNTFDLIASVLRPPAEPAPAEAPKPIWAQLDVPYGDASELEKKRIQRQYTLAPQDIEDRAWSIVAEEGAQGREITPDQATARVFAEQRAQRALEPSPYLLDAWPAADANHSQFYNSRLDASWRQAQGAGANLPANQQPYDATPVLRAQAAWALEAGGYDVHPFNENTHMPEPLPFKGQPVEELLRQATSGRWMTMRDGQEHWYDPDKKPQHVNYRQVDAWRFPELEPYLAAQKAFYQNPDARRNRWTLPPVLAGVHDLGGGKLALSETWLRRIMADRLEDAGRRFQSLNDVHHSLFSDDPGYEKNDPRLAKLNDERLAMFRQRVREFNELLGPDAKDRGYWLALLAEKHNLASGAVIEPNLAGRIVSTVGNWVDQLGTGLRIEYHDQAADGAATAIEELDNGDINYSRITDPVDRERLRAELVGKKKRHLKDAEILREILAARAIRWPRGQKYLSPEQLVEVGTQVGMDLGAAMLIGGRARAGVLKSMAGQVDEITAMAAGNQAAARAGTAYIGFREYTGAKEATLEALKTYSPEMDPIEQQRVAGRVGTVVAVANAIIERFNLGNLIERIPGRRRLLVGMVEGALSEGSTEALQQLVTQWGVEAGEPKAPPGDVKEVVLEFLGGMMGSPVPVAIEHFAQAKDRLGLQGWRLEEMRQEQNFLRSAQEAEWKRQAIAAGDAFVQPVEEQGADFFTRPPVVRSGQEPGAPVDLAPPLPINQQQGTMPQAPSGTAPTETQYGEEATVGPGRPGTPGAAAAAIPDEQPGAPGPGTGIVQDPALVDAEGSAPALQAATGPEDVGRAGQGSDLPLAERVEAPPVGSEAGSDAGRSPDEGMAGVRAEPSAPGKVGDPDAQPGPVAGRAAPRATADKDSIRRHLSVLDPGVTVDDVDDDTGDVVVRFTNGAAMRITQGIDRGYASRTLRGVLQRGHHAFQIEESIKKILGVDKLPGNFDVKAWVAEANNFDRLLDYLIENNKIEGGYVVKPERLKTKKGEIALSVGTIRLAGGTVTGPGGTSGAAVHEVTHALLDAGILTPGQLKAMLKKFWIGDNFDEEAYVETVREVVVKIIEDEDAIARGETPKHKMASPLKRGMIKLVRFVRGLVDPRAGDAAQAQKAEDLVRSQVREGVFRQPKQPAESPLKPAADKPKPTKIASASEDRRKKRAKFPVAELKRILLDAYQRSPDGEADVAAAYQDEAEIGTTYGWNVWPKGRLPEEIKNEFSKDKLASLFALGILKWQDPDVPMARDSGGLDAMSKWGEDEYIARLRRALEGDVRATGGSAALDRAIAWGQGIGNMPNIQFYAKVLEILSYFDSKQKPTPFHLVEAESLTEGSTFEFQGIRFEVQRHPLADDLILVDGENFPEDLPLDLLEVVPVDDNTLSVADASARRRVADVIDQGTHIDLPQASISGEGSIKKNLFGQSYVEPQSKGQGTLFDPAVANPEAPPDPEIARLKKKFDPKATGSLFETDEPVASITGAKVSLAQRFGLLDAQQLKIVHWLGEFGKLDKRMYNWIPKGVSRQRRPIQLWRKFIAKHPDAKAVINEAARDLGITGSLLDADGNLRMSPMEDQYLADGTPRYYGFARSLSQFLVDRLELSQFEGLRKAVMHATEMAYSRGEALAAPYYIKGVGNGGVGVGAVAGEAREFRVQSPIRTAHKTLWAFNLNSACPEFTIGNRACWNDACYLAAMGRGAQAIGYFERAMYTGEILQLSKDVIREMNRKTGGLRINGVGDITPDLIESLKDVIRHAAMRGLKLKIITKQKNTFEAIQSLAGQVPLNHVTVQPSLDYWWRPIEDDLVGKGSAAREINDANGNLIAMGLQKNNKQMLEMAYEGLGKEVRKINQTWYRKDGMTATQFQELRRAYPDVQIMPRMVVASPKEIIQALDRFEGKVILTLMHGVLGPGIHSEVSGDERWNYGAARHAVQWISANKTVRVFGWMPRRGGAVRVVKPGHQGLEDLINQQPAEKRRIYYEWLKKAICCQENDSHDACADCAAHCKERAHIDGSDPLPLVWNEDRESSSTPERRISLPVIEDPAPLASIAFPSTLRGLSSWEAAALRERRERHEGKLRRIYDSRDIIIARERSQRANFWRWFGDSKVVNDRGQPIPMRHVTWGPRPTPMRFQTQWATSSASDKIGHWVTNDSRLLDARAEQFLDAQHDFPAAGRVHTFPLYVRLTNPMVLAGRKDLNEMIADHADDATLTDQIIDAVKSKILSSWADICDRAHNPDDHAARRWVKITAVMIGRIPNELLKPMIESAKAAFKAMGHDGIWIRDDMGYGHSLVVFDGIQLKSTFNLGNYDQVDDNIQASIAHDLDQMGLYSPLERALERFAAKDAKTRQSGAEWAKWVGRQPGVKQAEIKWMKLEDRTERQTAAELLADLRHRSGPRLAETVLTQADGDTEYDQLQGGKLVMQGHKPGSNSEIILRIEESGGLVRYQTPHFKNLRPANMVLHMRANIRGSYDSRTGALVQSHHMEETQADWAAALHRFGVLEPREKYELQKKLAVLKDELDKVELNIGRTGNTPGEEFELLLEDFGLDKAHALMTFAFYRDLEPIALSYAGKSIRRVDFHLEAAPPGAVGGDDVVVSEIRFHVEGGSFTWPGALVTSSMADIYDRRRSRLPDAVAAWEEAGRPATFVYSVTEKQRHAAPLAYSALKHMAEDVPAAIRDPLLGRFGEFGQPGTIGKLQMKPPTDPAGQVTVEVEVAPGLENTEMARTLASTLQPVFQRAYQEFQRRDAIRREMAPLRKKLKGHPWNPWSKPSDWMALSVRRFARWVVERGGDRLTFSTGQTQYRRYDLRQYVEKVRVTELEVDDMGDPTYRIQGWNNGQKIFDTTTDNDQRDLIAHVGKRLAEEVVEEIAKSKQENPKETSHSSTIEGERLALGGHGLENLYDVMYVAAWRDFVGKYGGTVQKVESPGDAESDTHVWEVILPPALVAEIQRGLPLASIASGLSDEYFSPLERALRQFAQTNPGQRMTGKKWATWASNHGIKGAETSAQWSSITRDDREWTAAEAADIVAAMGPGLRETYLTQPDLRFKGHETWWTLDAGGVPKSAVEIIISVTGLSDTKAYYSSHWQGIENPILHIRGSRYVITAAGEWQGVESAHADEFQSDWAQTARKEGIKDDPKQVEKIEADIARAQKEKKALDAELKSLQDRERELRDELTSTTYDGLTLRYSSEQRRGGFRIELDEKQIGRVVVTLPYKSTARAHMQMPPGWMLVDGYLLDGTKLPSVNYDEHERWEDAHDGSVGQPFFDRINHEWQKMPVDETQLQERNKDRMIELTDEEAADIRHLISRRRGLGSFVLGNNADNPIRYLDAGLLTQSMIDRWNPTIEALKEKARPFFEIQTKLADLANRFADAFNRANRYERLHNLPGVWNNPWLKTDYWTRVAARRWLKEAVANGNRVISWPVGDTHARRSHQTSNVTQLAIIPKLDPVTGAVRPGQYVISHHRTDTGNPNISWGSVTVGGPAERSMKWYLGAELTKHILEEFKKTPLGVGYKVAEGEPPIKFGGWGHREYYDQMLPALFRDLGSKWGAIPRRISDPNMGEIWVMAIPDAMAEAISGEGISHFSISRDPITALEAETGGRFYSPLARALRQFGRPMLRQTGAAWATWAARQPGVKAVEIEWSGLARHTELLTARQAEELVKEEGIRIGQTVLTGEDLEYGFERVPYANLMDKRDPFEIVLNMAPTQGRVEWWYSEQHFAEKLDHYDIANMLGHIRGGVVDASIPDVGETPVFVADEFQSDWAQSRRANEFMEGAPGFNLSDVEKLVKGGVSVRDIGGTMPMPYESTQAWVRLLVRRWLLKAAQDGHTWIGWTTGDVQAFRYEDARSAETVRIKRSETFDPNEKRNPLTVSFQEEGTDTWETIYLDEPLSGDVKRGRAFLGPLYDETIQWFADHPKSTSRTIKRKAYQPPILLGVYGWRELYDNIVRSVIMDELKRWNPTPPIKVSTTFGHDPIWVMPLPAEAAAYYRDNGTPLASIASAPGDMGFYSPLQRALQQFAQAHPAARQTAAAWAAWAARQPGVRQAEIKWSGLLEIPGEVTAEEAAQKLVWHLSEQVYRPIGYRNDYDQGTPGDTPLVFGEPSRGLNLPGAIKGSGFEIVLHADKPYDFYQYRHSHWNIADPYAHVRGNARRVQGVKGVREATHIEEAQSDWAQAIRRAKKSKKMRLIDPAEAARVSAEQQAKSDDIDERIQQLLAEKQRMTAETVGHLNATNALAQLNGLAYERVQESRPGGPAALYKALHGSTRDMRIIFPDFDIEAGRERLAANRLSKPDIMGRWLLEGLREWIPIWFRWTTGPGAGFTHQQQGYAVHWGHGVLTFGRSNKLGLTAEMETRQKLGLMDQYAYDRILDEKGRMLIWDEWYDLGLPDGFIKAMAAWGKTGKGGEYAVKPVEGEPLIYPSSAHSGDAFLDVNKAPAVVRLERRADGRFVPDDRQYLIDRHGFPMPDEEVDRRMALADQLAAHLNAAEEAAKKTIALETRIDDVANEANALRDIKKEGVVDSPYGTSTAWMKLAARRAIIEAVRRAPRGQDVVITWTTGVQQRDRYERRVRGVYSIEVSADVTEKGEIRLQENQKGQDYERIWVVGRDKKGLNIMSLEVNDDMSLEDILGDELAAEARAKLKTAAAQPAVGARYIGYQRGMQVALPSTPSDTELDIGSHGLGKLYDKMWPAALAEVLEDHKPRFGTTKTMVGKVYQELPSVTIPSDEADVIRDAGFPVASISGGNRTPGQQFNMPDPSPRGKTASAGQRKPVFSATAAERAWQMFKQLPRDMAGWVRHTARAFKRLFQSFARIWPDLPRGARWNRAAQILLRLQKEGDLQCEMAARMVAWIVEPFGQGPDARDMFDLFARWVVFKDLQEDGRRYQVEPDGATRNPENIKLRNGMTLALVNQSLLEVEATIRAHPKRWAIRAAVDRRQSVWAQVRGDYLAAMEANGYDLSDVLTRDYYFRHMGDAILRGENLWGDSSTPILNLATKASYLQQRAEGAGFKTHTDADGVRRTESQSWDYLAVEHVILQTMLYDTAVARATQSIREAYDILGQVREKAKQAKKRRAEIARYKGTYRLFREEEAAHTDEITGMPVSDWRRFVPEGYVVWTPALQDNPFFLAWNVSNNAMERLRQGLEANGLMDKDLHLSMVQGIAVPMVIPQELAATLNNAFTRTRMSEIGQMFSRLWGRLIGLWKQVNLNSPERWIRSSIIRNLSGDLDTTIWMNPGALKHVGRATREIYAYMAGGWLERFKKRHAAVTDEDKARIEAETKAGLMEALHGRQAGQYPSDDFFEWWRRGGIGSTFQEIEFGSLPRLRQFQHLRDAENLVDRLKNAGLDFDVLNAQLTNARRNLEQTGAYFGTNPTPEQQERLDELRKRGVNVDDMLDQEGTSWAQRLMAVAGTTVDATVLRLWRAWFDTVGSINEFREAILRYANYLSYIEQMAADPEGNPVNWGGSWEEEIRALPKREDRAWQLSNEVVGAYDSTSYAGRFLAKYVIPFFRFQGANAWRYMNWINNISKDKNALARIGIRFGGVTALTAAKVGRLVLGFYALRALTQVWNEMFFPDDDDEIPEDVKDRPYLLFGRDDDGKVRYFDRLGSAGDFAEWFGLDVPLRRARQLFNGEVSWGQVLLEIGVRPADKALGGVGAQFKLPAELAFARTTPWTPLADRVRGASTSRAIEDSWHHIFTAFGFKKSYELLSKVPDSGLRMGALRDLWSYSTDPGEQAYYEIREALASWRTRVQGWGPSHSERQSSYALRMFKRSLRLNSRSEAEYWLNRYSEAGGSPQGVQASLKAMEPLYGLKPADKNAFIETLSDHQKRQLEKARQFYVTYLAPNDSELDMIRQMPRKAK